MSVEGSIPKRSLLEHPSSAFDLALVDPAIAHCRRDAGHEAVRAKGPWRFFIGFTVGGMAVPIIGALHRVGGFGEMLAVTAVIFACALATWLLSRGRTQLAAAPAE